jgi:hypothetical protein
MKKLLIGWVAALAAIAFALPLSPSAHANTPCTYGDPNPSLACADCNARAGAACFQTAPQPGQQPPQVAINKPWETPWPLNPPVGPGGVPGWAPPPPKPLNPPVG